MSTVLFEFRQTSNCALCQEQNGSKENQKGDQPGKGLVTRERQEDASNQAAKETYRCEAPKPWLDSLKMLSIAINTARGSHHESERARRIGHDWRSVEKQQRRESHKSAP